MPTAYVTAPPDAAPEIARTLVDERLAACVNRVDCQSTYRWEDEVHEEGEVVLLVKTTASAYESLESRILDLHPHDVPCIERFEEDETLPSFAAWRSEVTGAADGA